MDTRKQLNCEETLRRK